MKRCETSVRELVEFVLRRGDISSRYAGGVRSNLRALEGTRLHQKLQKRETGDYVSEVSLPEIFPLPGEKAELYVDGRADGLFTMTPERLLQEKHLRNTLFREQFDPEEENGEGILSLFDSGGDDLYRLPEDESLRCIDEIKSTEISLRSIHPDTYPLHFAQAAFYAYALARKEGLDKVLVRLSYIHVETEKVKYLYRLYTGEELETFTEQVVNAYSLFLIRQLRWEQERNESLTALTFPFESYRKGQRAMAAQVYRTIQKGRKTFLQAPTGIGKTMSALFPALKAQGEGLTEKLFYLTAKNVAGEAAERAAALLTEQGMKLKTIRIIARDRICFLEKRACNPIDCPYAAGHFDRVNDAVLDSLERFDLFDMERVRSIAREHKLCPYELSLDIASWCDLIICDFNYAFDPSASLKRFFASGKRPFTLLVDESHNLVDRARDMFSADLGKKEFLEARKLLPKEGNTAKSLAKALNAVNKVFLEAEKQLKIQQEPDPDLRRGPLWAPDRSLVLGTMGTLDSALTRPLERALGKMGEYMEELGRGGKEIPEDLWELYFRMLFFQRTMEEQDKGYEGYLMMEGADPVYRLFCIDPSQKLQNIYHNLKAVVFFSATLTPIDYYKKLLGAEPEDEAIALPSPFPTENRKTMIAPVPVTYRCRQSSAAGVSRLIGENFLKKPGHYLVFFSSYQYLDMVMDQLEESYPDLPVLRQTVSMTEEERQEFLVKFRTQEGPLLGACVLGGVFSEGIDLKGEALIGAMVVTIGLPQLSLERDLIKTHFDREDINGFEYAYLYPGIGRVLQAAGRVIRTPEDKGTILLIDSRFGEERVLSMLPEEWFPAERVDTENIGRVLENFWDRAEQ
ncbi:MAG: ATP-dependent DNA helicase [Lachnospiraceae bacterium]|nr:ATP-dependent DNA helicase [Lachnospiraceae bacterium]